MSLDWTYGLVSPDAKVETIIFGTPTGTACIAVVPMVVPAEPPSEIIPSISPAACFSAMSAAAPCAITATLLPLSPSSLKA